MEMKKKKKELREQEVCASNLLWRNRKCVSNKTNVVAEEPVSSVLASSFKLCRMFAGR